MQGTLPVTSPRARRERSLPVPGQRSASVEAGAGELPVRPQARPNRLSRLVGAAADDGSRAAGVGRPEVPSASPTTSPPSSAAPDEPPGVLPAPHVAVPSHPRRARRWRQQPGEPRVCSSGECPISRTPDDGHPPSAALEHVPRAGSARARQGTRWCGTQQQLETRRGRAAASAYTKYGARPNRDRQLDGRPGNAPPAHPSAARPARSRADGPSSQGHDAARPAPADDVRAGSVEQDPPGRGVRFGWAPAEYGAARVQPGAQPQHVARRVSDDLVELITVQRRVARGVAAPREDARP